MRKKSGIPEWKWKSHSSNNWFFERSYHASVKNVLGGALGKKAEFVKQYQKSEKNRKKDSEGLNKQNKMLFSMTKRLGSPRELKKIQISNKLFTNSRAEDNKSCLPLNILNIQREQQKELINLNSKPSV